MAVGQLGEAAIAAYAVILTYHQGRTRRALAVLKSPVVIMIMSLSFQKAHTKTHFYIMLHYYTDVQLDDRGLQVDNYEVFAIG